MTGLNVLSESSDATVSCCISHMQSLQASLLSAHHYRSKLTALQSCMFYEASGYVKDERLHGQNNIVSVGGATKCHLFKGVL